MHRVDAAKTARLVGTLAGAALACLVAVSARADPRPLWEAGVGVGVIDFPHYRGSDERHIWALPAPYFVYRGKYLKVDEHGMRGLVYRGPRAELDLSLNGTVPVKSSEDRAREGMPDLDPTVEIGPSLNFLLLGERGDRRRLELRLPLRAAISVDFPSARQVGWVFQPNLNLDLENLRGSGWNLGLLAGPVFSDRRYNRHFYAVDAAYATADRPAYDPGGGGYAGAQFIAALSRRYPNYWVGGFVKWDNLRGAGFEDSPLVKAKAQFTLGFAVAWILGRSRTLVEAK